jgi:hypothetical protein
MKREERISLSIAAACFLLVLPQLTLAQGSAKLQRVSSNSAQASAQSEAMQMVPAEVQLARELDAQKVAPGYKFQTTLQDKVQLKNGPELPRGTVLMGKVVTDKMHAGATSRLALRFTSAKLKDGKTIPIKATIVGVAGPADDTFGYSHQSAVTDGWNSQTLKMDVIGVQSGVDLHSSIGAKNSGVFVTNKKSDVKLAEGCRIGLAIAERTISKSSLTGGA